MGHEGHEGHEGHGEHEPEQHKLYLLKSPLVEENPTSDSGSILQHSASRGDIETLGYRDGGHHDCPEFQKHEEATNIELFYDLFFAANLTVFSEVHDVTNSEELQSYIGYFAMLWFTWALVGLFDVRFVTDSIFERLARSSHLGVMVGFAVVAANFDPSDQIESTFRAMSIILMVSRLTLAVQYSTIIWHVRKFHKTRLPLGLMAGTNIVMAIVYLGITFGFNGVNTHNYVAWYVLGALEVVLTASLSLFWPVLSFQGTHLINRMSLLTFIIIGEGIIVVCTNITLIVKQADSWTAPTIGTVTAGIATLYIVYQIYFDWMRHLHLPRYRQLLWAVLHFPFHLSLTLFVEGSAQFVIWYKIWEVVDLCSNMFDSTVLDFGANTTVTTASFVAQINQTINQIFTLYPYTFEDTQIAVNDAYDTLLTVPDVWWTTPWDDNDPNTITFVKGEDELVEAVFNSLLADFNIQGFTSVKSDFSGDEADLQEELYSENWNRFNTVFYYAFVAAGIVIILMNLLYIISRTTRWTPWNYFRAVLNTLAGLTLCLLSLINTNDDLAASYQPTPWILPTICLIFFFVLVVNHLPHPPPIFFRRSGDRTKRSGLLGALRRKRRNSAPSPNTAYHGSQLAQEPYREVQYEQPYQGQPYQEQPQQQQQQQYQGQFQEQQVFQEQQPFQQQQFQQPHFQEQQLHAQQFQGQQLPGQQFFGATAAGYQPAPTEYTGAGGNIH